LVATSPGCTGPVTEKVIPAITGHVDFSARLQAQAPSEEVATSTTVSLVDPEANLTVASTLTRPDRSFLLSTPGYKPKERTYYLDAIKRLEGNQSEQSATARLRTHLRWNGTSWSALTPTDASIGTGTTALAIIAALRAGEPSFSADTLLGKLTAGTPDVFEPTGTPVTVAEYTQVAGLVAKALQAGRDPLDAIARTNEGFVLKAIEGMTMPFITSLDPDIVSEGVYLVIEGGGFIDPPQANQVLIGNTALKVTSGSDTTLVALVPAGSEGEVLLQVKTPAGIAMASVTVYPAISGGVPGQSTSSATPQP
jgi:hypothetical protein